MTIKFYILTQSKIDLVLNAVDKEVSIHCRTLEKALRFEEPIVFTNTIDVYTFLYRKMHR